jgi:uncharacterized Tic20 family protein
MTEYPPPPPQSPQPPAAAQPLSESDERLWATLAHAGVILFGFIPPLIIWLVFRERSAFVNDQAKEALNWSILMAIASFVGAITIVAIIGFVILPLVGIAVLVFGILAAIAANKGEQYRYPFNWRIIK